MAGFSFTSPLPPFLQRFYSEAPEVSPKGVRRSCAWEGCEGERAARAGPAAAPTQAGCFGESERPSRSHFSSAPRLLSRTFLSSFLSCFAPSPAGAPSPACPQCRPPARPPRPSRVPAPRPRPRSAGRRGRLCACSGQGDPRGAERAGGGGDPMTAHPGPVPGPRPPRLLRPPSAFGRAVLRCGGGRRCPRSGRCAPAEAEGGAVGGRGSPAIGLRPAAGVSVGLQGWPWEPLAQPSDGMKPLGGCGALCILIKAPHLPSV